MMTKFKFDDLHLYSQIVTRELVISQSRDHGSPVEWNAAYERRPTSSVYSHTTAGPVL